MTGRESARMMRDTGKDNKPAARRAPSVIAAGVAAIHVFAAGAAVYSAAASSAGCGRSSGAAMASSRRCSICSSLALSSTFRPKTSLT